MFCYGYEQVVICEGCRLSSHQSHKYGMIVDLASAERARLREIGQQCRALSTALQGRIDALSASSKKCASAAYSVKQEITREFDRARAALLEREQQLTAEVEQIMQVRGETGTPTHTQTQAPTIGTIHVHSLLSAFLECMYLHMFLVFHTSFIGDCRLLSVHSSSLLPIHR